MLSSGRLFTSEPAQLCGIGIHIDLFAYTLVPKQRASSPNKVKRANHGSR